MNFKIKHIEISNFRCFEHLETDLWKETIVKGDNESGKSTLASAILWCLTGKDVDGSTTFEIVPAGKYGEVSPSVTLEGTINETPVTLKREYKAKLARDKSFKSYATVCSINGLDKGTKEYQAYISEKICDDALFKVLSNPYTFVENCPKSQKELMWQAQRRMLMNIVADVKDLDAAEQDPRWEPLVTPLKRYDTVSEYMSFLRKQSGEIEKKLSNFEAMKMQQLSNMKEVDTTEKEVRDEYTTLVEKVNALQIAATTFEDPEIEKISEAILKISKDRSEALVEYQAEMNRVYQKKAGIQEQIRKAETERDRLIAKQAQYATEVERLQALKVEEFCPTCHQHLPSQNIQETRRNIASRISNGTAWIEKARKQAEMKAKEIEGLNEDLLSLEDPVLPSECVTFDQQLEILETRRKDLKAKSKPSPEILSQIDETRQRMDYLREMLYTIKQNQECKEKVAQLNADNRKNSEMLSDIQMKTDLCREFLSEKCKRREASINSKFEHVRFKLFEQNKSNDEVREVCTMTWNGHGYEDLSKSTKLVACMELLNMLQAHYGVYVPIVIDNMESVTATISSPAQIVKMYVSEENCPECGGATGRRFPDGSWKCCKCGHTWEKTLSIKEG